MKHSIYEFVKQARDEYYSRTIEVCQLQIHFRQQGYACVFERQYKHQWQLRFWGRLFFALRFSYSRCDVEITAE